MGIKGFQDFWIVGSRFYMQRDDDTESGLYDFGVISNAAQPTMELSTIELIDGDGGVAKSVDEAVTQINEMWEIEIRNLSPAVLAAWFLASTPTAFTQPSATISAVDHTAVIESGKFVKVKDSTGAWLYNIASATVTGNGASPSYTENTDWKWADNQGKERGIIEIIAGGSIADGETIEITPVLNSVTGKRLVLPQSNGAAIKGRGLIVLGRGDNAQQTMREADISLTPTGAGLSREDYSSLTFRAKVLSDITDTDAGGRLLQAIGSVPETSTGS